MQLRIATRKSPLAVQQAEFIKEALQQKHPHLEIELVKITTEGDRFLDQYLNKIGGKGLFTKALEDALLEKRADIAVHSMKDVPNDLLEPFQIGAICKREAPHDLLISREKKQSLLELPEGGTLGTSSLRRQSQVLHARKDLSIKMLRGNINTRIKKMESGEYDAIILAAAGLERLNITHLHTTPLPLETFIPCAGQGALGIECRKGDQTILDLLHPLNDQTTHHCVSAERALSQRLGGNCQVPIGAYAFMENEMVKLSAFVGQPNGKILLHAEKSGQPTHCNQLGIETAEDLLKQGADRILRDLM